MSLAPGTKKYEKAVRETTLWEDVLVKHEILVPDKVLVQQQEALEESRLRGEKAAPTAVERILEARHNDEDLAKLEDELANDDDDARLLAEFRSARIQHYKQQAQVARYGFVERLGRDEFIPAVKEASKTGGPNGSPMPVVIELFVEGLERSMLTSRAVDELAKHNPTVKFVRMIADQCIEGWPDSRVPSIIVYKGGDLVIQLIGLQDCGNARSSALWSTLAKAGVLHKPEETIEASDDEDDNDRIKRVGARKRDEEEW